MQDKHTIRTSNMSSPLYVVSTITSVYENVGTKDIEATFRLSTDGGVWCLAKTQDDIMSEAMFVLTSSQNRYGIFSISNF